MKKTNADLFELFCENSNLNERNFASFINDFENEKHDFEKIQYPTIDLQLNFPKDKLFKIMCKRHSTRTYTGYKISEKQLSSLFSCFAEVNGRRLLPSGGGIYPIEVYALLFHVAGDLNEKIVYYNWAENALSVVADCPKWDEIVDKTGLLIEGEPSILFIFAAMPSKITSKYGERGGRFLFIEAGHYLQNLSLRVAFDGLKGVEAGGLFDNDIKNLLGLGGSEAIITLGYACGK